MVDVLHTLQEEGGGRMRLSALANAVLLSRSGLTRLLNQLEENGLIRRVDCEEDRGGLFAELTPGGRRAVERSWPAYNQALFNRISRRLGPGEARTLADLLGKLNVDERAR
jgi:DNA-binding MarR family transcriptional regulator